MNIRSIIAIGLLFFAGPVPAKTIQVGGSKVHPQETSDRCWNTTIQPVVFINGLQPGQQRSVTVALGLPINTCSSPCEASTDAAVSALENDKPVMVWYKDPKSNHSIIVNGRSNHRDDAGNIQWQQIHAQNGGCMQEQNMALSNPCDCVPPVIPVYGQVGY